MRQSTYLTLAFALIACQPKSPGSAATNQGVAPEPAPVQGESGTLTKPPAASASGDAPAGVTTAGAEPITVPRRQQLPAPTVREILETDTHVGRRVRVTGRCLGYSGSVAVGGPPVSRSDWELEADGVAIYVTGPLPEGCSATTGSTALVTITAVVAEDTLPALGRRPPSVRRYLVRQNP